VQSLSKKIEEFRFLFINSSIDVICVSETWFVSDVSNMSIMCKSFNLFRSDRSGRGGGVAVYINKKLNAKKVCVQAETSAIEYIFLSIFNKRENTSILIGCIYRPHKTTEYSELIELLSTLSLNYSDVILAGDFNSNILLEKHLSNDMESLGLFPVNFKYATHFSTT